MKTHSQKFLQKRKFAMVLPVLVLPFITMIFWALGGGQGSSAKAVATGKTGLNLELPDPHFNKDEEFNKLSLYEKAKRDSAKLKEAIKNDPYFNLPDLSGQVQSEQQKPEMNRRNSSSLPSKTSILQKPKIEVDPNEAKVNEKLAQLYQVLNKEQAPVATVSDRAYAPTSSDPQFSSDVDKLEKMMKMMKNGNEADPEMQQMEGMLDKILDIQHPDRAREKIKEQSELKKGQVFAVQAPPEQDDITTIKQPKRQAPMSVDSSRLLSKVFSVEPRQNEFYGLDDEADQGQAGNAIEAVVHDTQEIIAGSTVKLRLLNDVYVNGKLISKDQFIYGTAAINGERLTIAINSIRDDNSLFPVALSAYDLDGIEGIHIPGMITRDVAKQSSNQAMQSLQFMTMDQSLKTQAMNAGLQTAKGLFSKKVTLIRVTVKAGYKILLKDTKATV